MKFFAVLALLVAVASAQVLTPEQLQQRFNDLVEDINNAPNASELMAQLEQLFYELFGIHYPSAVAPTSVKVLPTPVEAQPTPVVVIPAPAPAPVQPEQPTSAAEASSPLVQIILNINSESSGLSPVGVVGPEAPVAPAPVVPAPEVAPPPAPVELPAPALPEVIPTPISPVEVAPAPISPVEVVPAPQPLEPVAVAPPTLPIGVAPVVLPEELN